MKRIQQLSALLLALCLATGMAPAAQAVNYEATVSLTISTGTKKISTAEVEIPWDDAWFASDASVYRHELALAAMALSGAAYRGENGIRTALQRLGFEGVETYNYSFLAESGTTAYALGVKTVTDADGSAGKLVAIVIRGTGEVSEWASNLDMGTGIEHLGFSRAKTELLASLTKYLSGAGISGTPETPVKFLVTGHSRGGAVANLTAAQLTDSQLAAGTDVFGYTFAAPTVSGSAAREGYGNIFNIVNGEDLVTQVPLKDWGYGRYGVDIPLPTKTGYGDAYDNLFQGMEQQYRKLTGEPYAAYQDPAAVQKMTAAIHQLAPNASSTNMAMLAAMLHGDLDSLSDIASRHKLAALLLGKRMLTLSTSLFPLLEQEYPGMVSAHCMAGYFSWLTAWEPPEIPGSGA